MWMLSRPFDVLTLLLVRHGHTLWHDTGGVAGRTDIGLSERGVDAVNELARNWAHSTAPDSWHCSPLSRTRRTMSLMTNAFGFVDTPPLVEYDERLVELDFGRWEGMTWSLVHEHHADEMRLWGEDWVHRSPPGGETFAQQAARCKIWLSNLQEKVAQSHQGKDRHTALVVTHGGSIRALLCLCLGWPLTRAMDFSVDPASRTRLDLINTDQGEQWIVRDINSVS